MKIFSLKVKVDREQAFIIEMFRQANIFAISFVCISSILLASAETIPDGIPGGYSKVAPKDLKDLQTKLQNSNFKTAMGAKDSNVKVEKINSAYQQVVAGMNYKIEATLLVDKKSKKCCFLVNKSLPQPKQTFTVKCAQCGSTCECFKEG